MPRGLIEPFRGLRLPAQGHRSTIHLRLDIPGQRWPGVMMPASTRWKMDTNSILVLILVGGIAGWLADKFVASVKLGLVTAIIVGILGAFVGSWLFGVLGISVGSGIVATIIVAFVGAVILLLIVGAVRRR